MKQAAKCNHCFRFRYTLDKYIAKKLVFYKNTLVQILFRRRRMDFSKWSQSNSVLKRPSYWRKLRTQTSLVHVCFLATVCPLNLYGWDCSQRCYCQDARDCDRFTGPKSTCTCKDGYFHPPYCEPGKYMRKHRLWHVGIAYVASWSFIYH